jgi:subtilisin family serine protease
MVAATAAAPANGIGTVGVYPQAVLRSFDAGELSTASVIAGIEAAITAGPGIINLSLGRPAGGESERAIYEEVILAFGTGSLLVASSGNEFLAGDPPLVPAVLPHVLTVAATDMNDDPSVFSSSSLAVDLAAPGEAIPFPHPTDPALYSLIRGTSFASPIVSAAAAWIWTVRPDLEITQLFDLIRSSARDVSDPGFDQRTGFGVLDIPAALGEQPPPIDPQEPNDDVDQVVAGGIFSQATPALGGNVRFDARLDQTEDPDDVYRILVPPRRTLTITVAGYRADVGAILWSGKATTVYDERCRKCLVVSDRQGNKAEKLVWRNTARKRKLVFLDVWVPEAAELSNPDYRVTLRTSR